LTWVADLQQLLLRMKNSYEGRSLPDMMLVDVINSIVDSLAVCILFTYFCNLSKVHMGVLVMNITETAQGRLQGFLCNVISNCK
jgi:hypothetical protein